MWRSIVAVLLIAPLLLGAKIWVGASTSPEEIAMAQRLLSSIPNLGANPSDQTLAAALRALLGDSGADPPVEVTIPAFVFEWPECEIPGQEECIPVNLCEAKKCEAVGAVVCEKEPGFGSKGSTITMGHCVTLCTPAPVKDTDAISWIAIECP